MDMDIDYSHNQHLGLGEDAEGWKRYALRLAVGAAFHPFDMSKTLIQLGYEPIAPRLGVGIFGQPVLRLPNIFQYAAHIRKVDGFSGCFRGLVPKLCGSAVSTLVTDKITEKFHLDIVEEKPNSNRTLTDEELFIQFKKKFLSDLIIGVPRTIVSHPFRVISVRMMAQFVGGEEIYKNMTGSIANIWKTEGILGFFSGLIPVLIMEVACLVLTNATVYIFTKYCSKDAVIRQYSSGLAQYFFSTLLYPLDVISSCMMVTGSPLKAGNPPLMPLYSNWYVCYRDLKYRNELNRGSSSIFRYAKIAPRPRPTPAIVYNQVD